MEFAGSGSENAMVNKFETELKTLLKPLKQGSQFLDDIFEFFAHKFLSSGGNSFHIRMLGSRAPVFGNPKAVPQAKGPRRATRAPQYGCANRTAQTERTQQSSMDVLLMNKASFKSDKMNDALANMSIPPSSIGW